MRLCCTDSGSCLRKKKFEKAQRRRKRVETEMAYGAALDSLSEEVRKAMQENPNDYIKDGLLMCGNCHTPKQARVTFMGIEKTPFCVCKCEAERKQAEIDARQNRMRSEEITRNRYNAFPDCTGGGTSEDDVRNWTFENDDKQRPDLTEVAKNYVENFETFREKGKGLLIYGTVGTGKSFISGCIANALLDKRYRVLMTSFSRIEHEVFSAYNKQEYYNGLNNYHLLILDDFGAERSSDYMQEIVYNVIDNRQRAGLPLIVTSNLTADQLKHPQNITAQRIYSRLLKMCHPLHVVGEDRRKQKAVQEFAETKKLLGL